MTPFRKVDSDLFALVVQGDNVGGGDVDEDNVDGGQAGQRKGDFDEDSDAYLIFVTDTTDGVCVKIFCHV